MAVFCSDFGDRADWPPPAEDEVALVDDGLSNARKCFAMACNGLCVDSALRDAGVRLLLAHEQLARPTPQLQWHGAGLEPIFAARLPPPPALATVRAACGSTAARVQAATAGHGEQALFVLCCRVWEVLRFSSDLDHYSHPLTMGLLESAGLGEDIAAAAAALRAAAPPGIGGRAIAELGPRIPMHMRGSVLLRLEVMCRLRGAVLAGGSTGDKKLTASAGKDLEAFMQADCGPAPRCRCRCCCCCCCCLPLLLPCCLLFLCLPPASACQCRVQ